MKTNDAKKSAIESNIKDIQKRIQELEQSFDSVNKDLSVEEEPLPGEHNSYHREAVLQEKSFSKYTPNQYDNRSRSNLKRFSRRDRQEDEFSDQNDNFETRKMVEGLLRENDILRENEKQADVKIETLTFRCEKLQTELTVKMDLNNKLLIENEERNGQVKNLLGQIKALEATNDHYKKSFLPELQRLKSQYDVAVLEIRSLEHDNSILEKRIQEQTESNSRLRDERREVDARNRQMEIEQLTLRKEIQEFKLSLFNPENELEDLKDKFDKLAVENERLKNEIMYLNQKNKIQVPGNDVVEDSFANYDGNRNFKTEALSGFDKRQENKRIGEMLFFDKKEESEQRSNWQYDRKDKAEATGIPSKLFMGDNDKLNFEQLAMIEDQLKRRNKN